MPLKKGTTEVGPVDRDEGRRRARARDLSVLLLVHGKARAFAVITA
jgi:hypothetical protein